jgi:hypothetical protein
MNHHITLCWEHIMIVAFPNYKCILMHNKETHFYLTTYYTKFILTNSLVSKYPNIGLDGAQ